jgi:hypothetical protein
MDMKRDGLVLNEHHETLEKSTRIPFQGIDAQKAA